MVHAGYSEHCPGLNNTMRMRHLVIKNEFDLSFMSF